MNRYTKFDGRIRLVFVFQVPSFWPSWDSFYEACIKDERFDVRMVLLDDLVTGDTAQMQNNAAFLEKKGIPYTIFHPEDVLAFRPHYMIYQTPYDKGHRPQGYWTMRYRRNGARIVYIPYGIEISDTAESHYKHFTLPPVLNAFRIYVMSEAMKAEYEKNCTNAKAVRAIGLPRFDAFAHKEDFPLPVELQEKIGDRKVILWKSHFPKVFPIGGKKLQATPKLEEFLKFVSYIREHQNLFFIFLPHPKYTDRTIKSDLRAMAVRLLEELGQCENVYIDWADDYRPSLMNADAIMIDRSAVMVEAGAVGCPVLYIYNEDYKEPMTPPIEALLDTYEKGSDAKAMIEFCDCVQNEETSRKMAERIGKEYFSVLDGGIGERIKDDLWESVQKDDAHIRQLSIGADTNLIIFGTGDIAEYCDKLLKKYDKGRILAYADNDAGKHGQVKDGVPVLSPEELRVLPYDYVVIATERHYFAIYQQLVQELHVSPEKIINYDEYLMACLYDGKAEEQDALAAQQIKQNLSKALEISLDEFRDEVFSAWQRVPQGLSEREWIKLLLEEIELLQLLDEENRKCSFAPVDDFVDMLYAKFRFIYGEIAKRTKTFEFFCHIADKFQVNRGLSFRENIHMLLGSVSSLTYAEMSAADAFKSFFSLPEGARVFIYGLGSAYGRMMKKYTLPGLEDKYQILGAMDASKNSVDFPMLKTKALENIDFRMLKEFDYILITTGKNFWEIRKELLTKANVPQEKIGMMDQVWMSMVTKIDV